MNTQASERSQSASRGVYTVHVEPSEQKYYMFVVTFTDPSGVRRFLPTRRKLLPFTKWTLTNCPRFIDAPPPKNIYASYFLGNTEPSEVLSWFIRSHPTPQQYLDDINIRDR